MRGRTNLEELGGVDADGERADRSVSTDELDACYRQSLAGRGGGTHCWAGT